MAASDWLEQTVLDTVLKNNALSRSLPGAGGTYVALFTSATADDGTGTEVTGGSYARENMVASDWTSMSGITTGIISNATEIAFTQATASWGTITHIAIMDASSGGNMLYHGALTASKTVDTNDTFKIAIGDLDITMS